MYLDYLAINNKQMQFGMYTNQIKHSPPSRGNQPRKRVWSGSNKWSFTKQYLQHHGLLEPEESVCLYISRRITSTVDPSTKLLFSELAGGSLSKA